MNKRYFYAIKHVLRWEGKHSVDPRDTGGETWYGIASRWHPNEVNAMKRMKDDNERRAFAVKFFYHKYWLGAKCDRLPASLSILAFDCAVNQGIDRSKRFVQEACGTKPDGVFGPMTYAAIKRTDERSARLKVKHLRIMRYTKSKTWDAHGDGWINRINDIAERALVYKISLNANQLLEVA